MRVPLKWIVIMLLTASSTLHAENFSFDPGDHGGIKPSLRGRFNNDFAGFKLALTQQAAEVFPDPQFSARFVKNVQYCFQNENITPQQILEGMYEDGAPQGFAKDPNSTYEMSRWSADYSTLKWGARDPEQGERFVWVKIGEERRCILSLKCANFMRPSNPGEQAEIIEEEVDYEVVRQQPKRNPIASYASYPQNINVTVNGGSAVATNTYSAPSTGGGLVFAQPNGGGGGYDNRQQYNNEPQEMIVRTPARAVDWVNAAGNLAMGVASIKQAFWPATQNIRVWGNQQPAQGNWGNGGGWHNGGNNHGGNHGGGGNNNNNQPWHGGTGLGSQGQLPNNTFYNPNNPGIIRGTHPYSNDASTGSSNWSSGSTFVNDSNGSSYSNGLFNNGTGIQR